MISKRDLEFAPLTKKYFAVACLSAAAIAAVGCSAQSPQADTESDALSTYNEIRRSLNLKPRSLSSKWAPRGGSNATQGLASRLEGMLGEDNDLIADRVDAIGDFGTPGIRVLSSKDSNLIVVKPASKNDRRFFFTRAGARSERMSPQEAGALPKGGVLHVQRRKTIKPFLWIPAADLNLGEIDLNKLRHHYKITVVNTGSEPLRIQNLKFDCACANASIAESSIGVYEAAEVDVVVRPAGRPVGAFDLRFIVDAVSSDGEPHSQVWKVSGKAVGYTHGFSPSVVSLGRVKGGSVHRISAHLKTATDSPPSVYPVFLDKGISIVDISRESNRLFNLILSVDTQAARADETGRFGLNAILNVGEDGRLAKLLVSGRKEESLWVMPNVIYLGRVSPGAVASCDLLVSGQGLPKLTCHSSDAIDSEVVNGRIHCVVNVPKHEGVWREILVVSDGVDYLRIPIIAVVGDHEVSTESEKTLRSGLAD